MAEPVRKLPLSLEWDEDDSPDLPVLQRWVARPDGEMELLELPLTRELFLNPELEDRILQGKVHGHVCLALFGLLLDRYEGRPDVEVLFDMKHFLGIPESAPGPDLSVIFGVEQQPFLKSWDVAREGARPSLVIEVISPDRKEIRDVDTDDKVRIYERAGIPEYILTDPPRPLKPGFMVWGYRLDPRGRYQPIEQDAEGYILSETTGLLFPVSTEGDRLFILDAKTRLPLPYPNDLKAARRAAEEQAFREAEARKAAEERAAQEAEARKAAEERAAQEAEARQAAEAEMVRLREELARLKNG
ncbi:MAG TPA: Uma2 family endonuclease [Thermoanaerobaculia bacterium]|nr:Uma2 family endonuclease [Thermoanaerobaculia bacterium]